LLISSFFERPLFGTDSDCTTVAVWLDATVPEECRQETYASTVEVVRSGRVDLRPLLTHTFPLEKISEAYELFGERMGGALKIAVKP